MKRLLLLGCVVLPLAVAAGEEPARPQGQKATTAAQSAPAVPPVQERAQVRPAAPAPALTIPPYEAKYTVRYGGIKVGELTQQLATPLDGNQTLQTVAYTTGIASWLKNDTVTERSIWREEGGRLLPLSYTYRYSGRSKETIERLDFDWERGLVKSLRDGKVTELQVERGTLDKHMHQLVLRQDLLYGARPLSYPVAERGKLKQYDFELLGEERLQTEHFGTLDCLKVRKGSTTFWVARRFEYLPVRIEKDEDGTLVSSDLIEYRGQ